VKIPITFWPHNPTKEAINCKKKKFYLVSQQFGEKRSIYAFVFIYFLLPFVFKYISKDKLGYFSLLYVQIYFKGQKRLI
jgi:hypothetical protein